MRTLEQSLLLEHVLAAFLQVQVALMFHFSKFLEVKSVTMCLKRALRQPLSCHSMPSAMLS